MLILGKTFRRLGLLLVLVTASLNAHAQQQRVEVQLSASRVSIEESVVVNIRAYSLDAELNISALGANFDVTQRSSSRQVAIDNGKRTSVVEWVLELIPKRLGLLEVGPIIVGTEQSIPLSLLVEPPASGTSRELYLEASVDISNPFVQAQVIYTLKVFQDVRFLDASLNVPEVPDALLQQLSDDRRYQENVDGRDYAVSEIRYAVVPQRSGKIAIPSIALKAVVPVDRNQVPNTRTRTKTLTRRAEIIELDVRPRPDGLTGSWWLPAKEVQLQSTWSVPIDSLNVDQPVTRTIQLIASGVADSQLPQLEVPEVAGISIYADSPTGATNASEAGLISQQTNTWAVIPQVAGTLVIPEVRVNWFDTVSGESRVAVLPEETFTVTSPAPENGLTPGATTDTGLVAQDTPVTDVLNTSNTDALIDSEGDPLAESSVGDQDMSAPNNMVNALEGGVLPADGHWRSIAYALLAGWVLSLLGIGFWWRKKFTQANDSTLSKSTDNESGTDRFRRQAGSRASLEAVKLACESGDVSKTAHQILKWGSMVWPKNPPTHISEVANRLHHQPLSDIFEAIDARQYRPEGSVKPVAVDAIPQLMKVAIEQYREPEDVAINTNALPTL